MVDDDRTLKTGGDTDGGITGAAVVVEIKETIERRQILALQHIR